MTNWPVKTLGEIFRVRSSKRVLKSEWKQIGVPFYRGREISSLSRDGRVDNELFISEDHFDRLARDYGVPKSGDIMITAIGTIGNSYVVKDSDRFYFKDASVLWLNKRSEMHSGFLQHWIASSGFKKQLSTGNGATVDTLTINGLSKMQLSVPPLEEQKRIVALLDAATARVTELSECYEQARTHAQLLSGSLLVDLLAGVVDSKPMRLGEIAELKGRIGWRGLTAKEYTKEGPLFVSVHSLNYGHFVNLKDAFHISQKRYDESPEIMLKNNDILICKDGAGIGKLGMVGQLPGPATINSSLLLIRASKEVRSEFLYFYLLSPIFQNLVQERLSGSTTPHLYQRDIAELVIKLPSLETQDQLIGRLWRALRWQSDLVECFNQQIQASMQMRQSILEAAFAGQL